MIVRMTRKASFSAGHSYYLPTFTPQQNQALFGIQSSNEGHGHNYVLKVTVEGSIDPLSGIVVNISEIDKVLKHNVVSELDGKFLNREVDFFRENAPSTENIVRFCYERLKSSLPDIVEITRIEVAESETLWSSWNAPENQRHPEAPNRMDQPMGEVRLTRKYDFSAAHRLHSNALSPEDNVALFGKCNHPNFHGHNYEVEVSISGSPNAESGMLFDLTKLDRIVEEVILTPFDHRNLNLDIPEFENDNPTSEMLAVVVWNRLSERISTEGSPKLANVLIRETARNEFEYCGR